MEFMDFYSKYPRKIARKEAEKAWKSLKQDEKELAIEAIDIHIEYWRIKETKKEFIPHPASWLRAARYEDELDMEPKKPNKPPLPWFSTEQLTMAKAKEMGMSPRPGEDMGQFRSRIAVKVAELA